MADAVDASDASDAVFRRTPKTGPNLIAIGAPVNLQSSQHGCLAKHSSYVHTEHLSC